MEQGSGIAEITATLIGCFSAQPNLMKMTISIRRNLMERLAFEVVHPRWYLQDESDWIAVRPVEIDESGRSDVDGRTVSLIVIVDESDIEDRAKAVKPLKKICSIREAEL